MTISSETIHEVELLSASGKLLLLLLVMVVAVALAAAFVSVILCRARRR